MMIHPWFEPKLKSGRETKIAALAMAFVLAQTLPVWAGNFSSEAIGTTAADFLEMGVGARAIAMGGAYTAAADDATALYWNPAAMTQVVGKSATLMSAAYIANTSFDYGSYVQNLGSYGAFGIGVQYFSYGSIPTTDASFNSTGNASPNDMATSIGYAYKWKGYSFGVAGKLINSTLVSSAQTEAMDAGILSPDYLDGRLKLALDMQNLGGSLRYDQVPEPLPLTFKLGGAYHISSNWLWTLDLALPQAASPYIATGTEYLLVSKGAWRFAGRAGFSSETVGGIAGFTGFAMGIGAGYKGTDFDYAFVPYGGLGDAQRISLTYNF